MYCSHGWIEQFVQFQVIDGAKSFINAPAVSGVHHHHHQWKASRKKVVVFFLVYLLARRIEQWAVSRWAGRGGKTRAELEHCAMSSWTRVKKWKLVFSFFICCCFNFTISCSVSVAFFCVWHTEDVEGWRENWNGIVRCIMKTRCMPARERERKEKNGENVRRKNGKSKRVNNNWKFVGKISINLISERVFSSSFFPFPTRCCCFFAFLFLVRSRWNVKLFVELAMWIFHHGNYLCIRWAATWREVDKRERERVKKVSETERRQWIYIIWLADSE